MQLKRHAVAIVLTLIGLTTASGCDALEEGLRDGVVNGSSDAISTLITAPVEALIDRWAEDNS